ncbi:MAG: BF3164 family lipoprotein [Longimicrobiales bacterium]|nr:BF3164 family lipoprotein [Longimicrobiales bacterium]
MIARLSFSALLIVGLLFVGGDARELPGSPTEAAPAGGTRLAGSVLHQSDVLAAPSRIEVAGPRLILADDFGDRAIRVLRRADGSLERSFGRRGRGPREFETVMSIDVLDPAGRLMLHDPMLQRVTWVDLAADFENGEWVADRSLTLTANAMVLEAGWTPDGLLGIGAFTGGRLAHLGPDGHLVRTSGSPTVRAAEVSPSVWRRSYQARLSSDPDRTRWAVAHRFADRIDIYDARGEWIAPAHRVHGFGPEDLREEDPGRVRFGYIDVTATDRRVYALFSGRTRAEGAANAGDRVHVFDWDGRLIEVWTLDARLLALAIDPAESTLYGIRHEPTPAVVAYAVP